MPSECRQKAAHALQRRRLEEVVTFDPEVSVGITRWKGREAFWREVTAHTGPQL